ncbi:MAG: ethylbenzene dehydrogenase-related protein [bacterium]
MRKLIVSSLCLLFCLAVSTSCFANQNIVPKKVANAPVIDGRGTDSVWAKAKEYTIHDNVAKVDITLKAVYTDKEIFFLVSYPDPDKSDTHKTWEWNKTMEMYKQGPDREDMFVFKWNMEPKHVDLSLTADNDYMADVWFWKACRTDPAGYADDKFQQFSSNELPKSTKLTSRSGKTMHLVRKGDSGKSAYKDTLYAEYKGDRMPTYDTRTPEGSRADIRAKGVWSGGRWTIEFSRALNTGNEDDIQFDMSKKYLFGVSRYEIAGRKPDTRVSQPLYGSGDISETLTLEFWK